MFRIFLLILLVSISFWLPTLYRRTTHAFRPAKCLIDWPLVADWEVEADPEVVSLFKQPFYYLAKGGQSYVFASKDGNYVLKLFRYDCCPIPYGKKWAAQMAKWCGKKERHYVPPIKQIPTTFSSCMVAYRLARKQTGLIYVHLNPKGGLPILTVYDRLGRKHQIDPARYRFALQRKGESFASAYTREGEAYLNSYKSLLRELAAIGVGNTDPKLQDNFGYLDGKAFVLDFGKLAYCPENTAEQIAQFEAKLSRWIAKHPR